LKELRERFRREFVSLPERHKALRAPGLYDVRTTDRLEQLRESVVQETKKREILSTGLLTEPAGPPSPDIHR